MDLLVTGVVLSRGGTWFWILVAPLGSAKIGFGFRNLSVDIECVASKNVSAACSVARMVHPRARAPLWRSRVYAAPLHASDGRPLQAFS